MGALLLLDQTNISSLLPIGTCLGQTVPVCPGIAAVFWPDLECLVSAVHCPCTLNHTRCRHQKTIACTPGLPTLPMGAPWQPLASI